MINENIMGELHDFHAIIKFEKSLNAPVIALTSKKFGALEVEDFQPISVVSGVYKIIAEVLANTFEKGCREDYFKVPKCICQR